VVNTGLFLDTSGWFAALSPKESRHATALAAYQQAVAKDVVLLTTNLVLAEMHILIARLFGRAAGVEFLDRLRADASHEIVWTDAELTAAAVDRWLRPFADHPLSLCDAVSFEVMRRRGLRRALALDRHFAVAGFQVL
jgi:uncharacterized protein